MTARPYNPGAIPKGGGGELQGDHAVFTVPGVSSTAIYNGIYVLHDTLYTMVAETPGETGTDYSIVKTDFSFNHIQTYNFTLPIDTLPGYDVNDLIVPGGVCIDRFDAFIPVHSPYSAGTAIGGIIRLSDFRYSSPTTAIVKNNINVAGITLYLDNINVILYYNRATNEIQFADKTSPFTSDTLGSDTNLSFDYPNVEPGENSIGGMALWNDIVYLITQGGELFEYDIGSALEAVAHVDHTEVIKIILVLTKDPNLSGHITNNRFTNYAYNGTHVRGLGISEHYAFIVLNREIFKINLSYAPIDEHHPEGFED